jgi:precorrin-6B methylase 2
MEEFWQPISNSIGGTMKRKHYSEVFGYYNTNFEIDKISQLAIGRKRALEIGAFIGKSTVAIAMNAENVLTIDPFDCHHSDINKDGNLERGKGVFNNLPAYLDNIKGYDNIQYFIGTSQVVLPTLRQTFDYIFIDGDHSFEGVLFDLINCWPLLEEGGVLVLHDYGNVNGYLLGIQKAFDMCFDSYDGLQDTVVWKIKRGEVIKCRK